LIIIVLEAIVNGWRGSVIWVISVLSPINSNSKNQTYCGENPFPKTGLR
jgi:hypothetical protein